MTKICDRCGEEKDVEEFFANSYDAERNVCINCFNQLNASFIRRLIVRLRRHN